MVEIKKVISKKEQKEFLNFPLDLYKDNPYFVPPLYVDEKKIFNKNYLYNDTCDTIFFNAYKDGKIVGRISGILQKTANEKWNQKRVRFTRFDSIDDSEVARELFKAIEIWAKEKDMEEVVGPLGYSDLEREGLLIEGFEYLSTFEEQYNYPYYQRLIEENGYSKDVDWIEHRLKATNEKNEKLYKLSAALLKRYDLTLKKLPNTKYIIKHYGTQLFKILDESYDKIYGTVPFTPGMKKLITDNFKYIVNLDYIGFVTDKNDNIVGFAISFPAIGECLQKSKGHITLTNVFKLLRAIKHPKRIDMGLVGVLPEYENKGIASALIAMFDNSIRKDNVEYAETNLNLEDNVHILNQWKYFDSIRHKRRRCFIKRIVNNKEEV